MIGDFPTKRSIRTTRYDLLTKGIDPQFTRTVGVTVLKWLTEYSFRPIFRKGLYILDAQYYRFPQTLVSLELHATYAIHGCLRVEVHSSVLASDAVEIAYFPVPSKFGGIRQAPISVDYTLHNWSTGTSTVDPQRLRFEQLTSTNSGKWQQWIADRNVKKWRNNKIWPKSLIEREFHAKSWSTAKRNMDRTWTTSVSWLAK